MLWISDPHFDFVPNWREVIEAIDQPVIISGDIGNAYDVEKYLDAFKVPVYFVLGNHDFYGSSVAEVRERVSRFDGYLTRGSHLVGGTLIVGHDGWADGGFGDFYSSPIWLNDFNLIQDFAGLTHHQCLPVMQRLANEACEHLTVEIQPVKKIIIVTHPSPFVESAGPGEDYLPFFTSRKMGDVIDYFAFCYPKSDITVLCGHSHFERDVRLRKNLRVLSGRAKYGQVYKRVV